MKACRGMLIAYGIYTFSNCHIRFMGYWPTYKIGEYYKRRNIAIKPQIKAYIKVITGKNEICGDSLPRDDTFRSQYKPQNKYKTNK